MFGTADEVLCGRHRLGDEMMGGNLTNGSAVVGDKAEVELGEPSGAPRSQRVSLGESDSESLKKCVEGE